MYQHVYDRTLRTQQLDDDDLCLHAHTIGLRKLSFARAKQKTDGGGATHAHDVESRGRY